MALVLPSLPDDLAPFVGKPPKFELRNLPYPGGLGPRFSYLKELTLAVPVNPDGVTSDGGYVSLLNLVFEIEEASDATDWAKL